MTFDFLEKKDAISYAVDMAQLMPSLSSADDLSQILS